MSKNGCLAITFEPEKLDGKSKALKTLAKLPLKILVKKLAFGVGAQGPVTLVKNA